MKRQKGLRKPTPTEDLPDTKGKFLQKLCARVPRIIAAVFKAKSGRTKPDVI